MLLIFDPPKNHLSVEDRFGSKTLCLLMEHGVSVRRFDLWPGFFYRRLLLSCLPGRRTLFHHGPARLGCWLNLRQVKKGDAVWVNGPSLPLHDTQCRFERAAKAKGAAYIFWLEDDLFSDDYYHDSAVARALLADLVICVTPALCDRVREYCPGRNVLLLEEPIDTERVQGVRKIPGARVVVWNGRPNNLHTLQELAPVLKRVYEKMPFEFRLIVGRRRPLLDLSIPWTWQSYDRLQESELCAGAVAAVAPLADTPYNQCKGNYKVKNYLALGIPPVTTSVGYNQMLVRHGFNGFLADSEDEWVLALDRLLNEPGLAMAMGSNAREDAIARFSHERLIPKWAAMLKLAMPALVSLRGAPTALPEDHASR